MQVRKHNSLCEDIGNEKGAIKMSIGMIYNHLKTDDSFMTSLQNVASTVSFILGPIEEVAEALFTEYSPEENQLNSTMNFVTYLQCADAEKKDIIISQYGDFDNLSVQAEIELLTLENYSESQFVLILIAIIGFLGGEDQQVEKMLQKILDIEKSGERIVGCVVVPWSGIALKTGFVTEF